MTEIHERTFTDKRGTHTVRYGIKQCANCGGDVEIPESEISHDRFSLCSVQCMDEWDGSEYAGKVD